MYGDFHEYKDNAPILEDTRANSFRREYGFTWKLSKSSQAYNWNSAAQNVNRSVRTIISDAKKLVGNFSVRDVTKTVMDSLAAGKMAEAYTMFELNVNLMADFVSGRAKSITLPDDEIEIENYNIGNTTFPVPASKRMGDISVTYVDDKFNNVYNFHKIWQECLRPGSDLSFMDIPSFSLTGTYTTTDDHLSVDDLRNLYQNPNLSGVSDYKKEYSKTVYPLIFPRQISRGTMSVDSENMATVKVTYIRTPLITKAKALSTLTYNGGIDYASTAYSLLGNDL